MFSCILSTRVYRSHMSLYRGVTSGGSFGTDFGECCRVPYQCVYLRGEMSIHCITLVVKSLFLSNTFLRTCASLFCHSMPPCQVYEPSFTTSQFSLKALVQLGHIKPCLIQNSQEYLLPTFPQDKNEKEKLELFGLQHIPATTTVWYSLTWPRIPLIHLTPCLYILRRKKQLEQASTGRQSMERMVQTC